MSNLEDLEADPRAYYEGLAAGEANKKRKSKFLELADIASVVRTNLPPDSVSIGEDLKVWLTSRNRAMSLFSQLGLDRLGLPKGASKNMLLEANEKRYPNPKDAVISEVIAALGVDSTIRGNRPIVLMRDSGETITAMRCGAELWTMWRDKVDEGLWDCVDPVTLKIVGQAFLAFYREAGELEKLISWKRQELQPTDPGERKRLREEARAKVLKDDEEFQKSQDQFLIDQKVWDEKFAKDLAALEAEAGSFPSPSHAPFSATESIDGDGKRSGIAIDRQNNLIAVWNDFNREIVAFRDIVSSEVCIDGATVVKSDFMSLLGRAAIGGFLFSGVGAIIGGVTGSKTESRDVKKVELKVLAKNTRQTIHLVCFYEKGTWGWATPDSGIKNAGHWHDLLTVAMKEAADHESALPSFSVAPSAESLPTQLAKLAELHRGGAISEAEFKQAKQKLLG